MQFTLNGAGISISPARRRECRPPDRYLAGTAKAFSRGEALAMPQFRTVANWAGAVFDGAFRSRPTGRRSPQVFAIAHVILPMSRVSPAEAIRASLAPFQRGTRGELPEAMLTFHDETASLRSSHATAWTFTLHDGGGLGIDGGEDLGWHLDLRKVRDEMARRGLRRWQVRFADETDLDAFFETYAHRLERHPVTGGYGRWLNPLGRWDWWDLGGRFDGRIIGEASRAAGRRIAGVSSGPSAGRAVLANVGAALGRALGEEPAGEVEVLNDRNVELVATLLMDAEAGREHAFPGALVLPPGAVGDELRWLAAWPEPGPPDAFRWLGLAGDAAWPEVVVAAYRRFPDHWAAGVAYHL